MPSFVCTRGQWGQVCPRCRHYRNGGYREGQETTLYRKKSWYKRECATKASDTVSVQRDISEVLKQIGLHESILDQVKTSSRTGQNQNGNVCDTAEDVMQMIVSKMRFPVSALRELVRKSPEILLEDADKLYKRYLDLERAWPSRTQLQRSILSYPEMLYDTYGNKLKSTLKVMVDMGFSGAETAAMVVKEPRLADLRQYEINNALKRNGIDLNSSAVPKHVKSFILKNPNILTRHGSRQLAEVLEGLKACGFSEEDALVLVTSASSSLFKRWEERKYDVNIIIEKTLRKLDLDEEEVQRVVKAYPAVLTMSVQKVSDIVSILKMFGISKQQVLQYPRVFAHSPHKVLGPRLKVLSKYAPDKMKLKLSSLFSVGDDDFSDKFVPSEEDYEKLQMQWIIRNANSEQDSDGALRRNGKKAPARHEATRVEKKEGGESAAGSSSAAGVQKNFIQSAESQVSASRQPKSPPKNPNDSLRRNVPFKFKRRRLKRMEAPPKNSHGDGGS